MTPETLQNLLTNLRGLPEETEWMEFKRNWDLSDDIGRYLSGLSNVAALLSKEYAYLIWGIENGSHDLVGTEFKPRQTKGCGNEDLEPWLLRLLNPRIDFRIYEFEVEGKPVVIFEIPAARETPVAFSGTRYFRVGSYLKRLDEFPEKEAALWRALRNRNVDWSAGVVDQACLDDLDPEALVFARQQYRMKHPGRVIELDTWDDITFLNKAKVCIGGQITRTALLLLGREESSHWLSPAQAHVTWVLRSAQGVEMDYSHFDAPLILAGDRLMEKVRNLTIRQLPSGTLFPHEITQYDPWVIRETLHNCIAHQEYSSGGRISIVETPDALLFTNLGSFIPGTVEEVIANDAPPEVYRNPFLANAMVNLNMIDTIGSGIKRVFSVQRKRSFPMPDYDLSDPGKVAVRISGRVIDENYTKLLLERTDLELRDVIALDRVQKKRPLNPETLKHLKKSGLIEGRRPNFYVSAKVAAATGDRAAYLKNRGLDKEHYKELIKLQLRQFGPLPRNEIDAFLREKISDALDDEQKTHRIRNLLQEMRREKTITTTGRGPAALWELSTGLGKTEPGDEPDS
jgi:ATP-dependent DNA helicase RecG